MGRPRGAGERGEQTRAKILATAELLFGERGFAETRLEDVAEAVGVRRAALVYYFTDKQDLYRAVLDDVFGGLARRMVIASESQASPAERVEAMAAAWVDYVAERPAAARLYLREIANATPGRPPAIADYVKTVYDHVTAVVRQGERAGAFRRVNTVHLLGMVAGATLLFTVGVPALGIEPSYDPLSSRELAAHREEIVRMTRGLLGLNGVRARHPTKTRSLPRRRR
jgi:TetR/AcrR family transcriptional regulator